jgi:hypothetical protein
MVYANRTANDDSRVLDVHVQLGGIKAVFCFD